MGKKKRCDKLRSLGEKIDEKRTALDNTVDSNNLNEILVSKQSSSFKELFDDFSSGGFESEMEIVLMLIYQFCNDTGLKQEIRNQTSFDLESVQSLDSIRVYIEDLLSSGAYQEAKTMLFVLGNTTVGKSSMIRTLQSYTRTQVGIEYSN